MKAERKFYFGVDEDRTREQFTARITRHPAGKPGHVYLAEDLAYLRANTPAELERLMVEYCEYAEQAS